SGTQVITQFSSVFPSSHGYLAQNVNLKSIILAFSGTRRVLSVVADAMVWMSNWPEGDPDSMVHSGFLSSYQANRDKFIGIIFLLLKSNPDYKIAFVGHSLGAAQAVIAASDFAKNYPELIPHIELYAFGQPRVGNKGFVDIFNAYNLPVVRRVTNKDDIVPHLPLLQMGYINYNDEYWIRHGDNQAVQCDVEESGVETRFCSRCQPLWPNYTWLTHHLVYWDVKFWEHLPDWASD
ncbi:Alpha/Beta hydrolase protein, partial [Dimargaris cristalligena]